jgi:energy-converting hydrogenase Eha subunit C
VNVSPISGDRVRVQGAVSAWSSGKEEMINSLQTQMYLSIAMATTAYNNISHRLLHVNPGVIKSGREELKGLRS